MGYNAGDKVYCFGCNSRVATERLTITTFGTKIRPATLEGLRMDYLLCRDCVGGPVAILKALGVNFQLAHFRAGKTGLPYLKSETGPERAPARKEGTKDA